jgi:hypothetical protein
VLPNDQAQLRGNAARPLLFFVFSLDSIHGELNRTLVPRLTTVVRQVNAIHEIVVADDVVVLAANGFVAH